MGVYPDSRGTALEKSVEKYLDEAYEHASKQKDFRELLVVVVPCGVGRAIMNFLPDMERPNCRIQIMAPSALSALSHLREFNELSLWRILDAENALANLVFTFKTRMAF